MARPIDEQTVRRLEADVRLLQAQVESMINSLVVFGEELQRSVTLTARLAGNINELAGLLAERRSA